MIFLREVLRGAVRWAVGTDWAPASTLRELSTRVEVVADSVRRLQAQFSACQALDIGLHDGGKAIVMTRVNGQDRVKIVDIAADTTVEQYRHIVETLQATYGAPPRWIDRPAGQSGELIKHVFTGSGK